LFNSDNETEIDVLFSNLKRGLFMRKNLSITLLVSTLTISTLFSPVFGNGNLDKENRSNTEQGIGFGAGATVGGLVAGPIGMITGALIGSLIGQNASNVKYSNQLIVSNNNFENKLDTSAIEIKTLKAINSQQAIVLNDAHHAIENLFIQNKELKNHALNFDVQFRTNSTEIEKQYENYLIDLARSLNTSPTIDIEISGYSDRTGNEEYNLELSNRRAMQVKEFLIDNGVEEDRIITLAHGESQPLQLEENLENNFFDRRVSVFLMPSDINTKNTANEIVTEEEKLSIAIR
jgi:sortase system peptidoglycan-associated protein